VVLILLAILVAALVVLAAVRSLVPPHMVTFGTMGGAAAIAVLACVALVVPDMASFQLPPLWLALDPMGASFLLLMGVAATARADAGPLTLAGMALALIAGNGFALTAGLVAVIASREDRRNIWPIVSIICLIAAFALMGHAGAFSAIRALQPPDAPRAAVILALTLIAAIGLLRVAPLLAAYLALRALFDLCGPVQPLWWALPLLIAGAAIAVATTWRAATADTLHTSMSANVRNQFGIALVALGVALLARAVDLPSLTTLALEAFWLAVMCLSLCEPLLLHAADSIERAAGTRQLDRLGGLIRGLPSTSACCLAGLFTLSIAPPGLGFAAFWQTLTSLLAISRADGLGLQLLVALTAAAIALSLTLATLSGVRLFATAFLGRPRTPRAAVAEELPRQTRLELAGLAALVVLLGIIPGLARLPAIGWSGGTAFPLDLRPAYSAIVIAGLLAIAASIATWIRRQGGAREQRSESAWMDGFSAPPPWLPFGDPATQIGPASFIDPLRRLLPSLPMLPIRTWFPRSGLLLSSLADAVSANAIPVTLIVIIATIAAWLVAS
jgi:formate hydrogenlyase subunit 3/multisubunit Na+/H+ antiporter MnhD subunit